MKTPPNRLLAVLSVGWAVCAVRCARDIREVYEAAADEPFLSPWTISEPIGYEPNPDSLRRFNFYTNDDLIHPQPQQLYQIRQLYSTRRKGRLFPLPPDPGSTTVIAVQRARISEGLLTFGQQTPDIRIQKSVPILVVRQLPVDAFLDGNAPPPLPPPSPVEQLRSTHDAGLVAGVLTFGTTAAPPTTTQRPWWRQPPPVQIPVRPRLNEAASETLAVGSSPLVARFHGPVAMGSGGVGYARLPDGTLAIGSGSIGFAQFDVLSV